ncbi:NFACT family protein, partial [Staphylococcus aureus]
VLPGQDYKLPPAQDKISPLEASEDDILRHLSFQEGRLDKQIVDHFSGVSPLFAKEAVHRAGLANKVTLPKALLALFAEVKEHRFIPN